MLVRERNSATYQVSAYYVSKILLEAPIELLATVLWSAILYFAIPFKLTPGAFFFYVLIIDISADCGVAMAQLAAALFDSPQVASSILTVFMSMMMIFSGFFMRPDVMPDYWIWMYWISYTHYAIAAVTINEFGDNSDYGAAGPETLASYSLTNVNQFTMMGGLMASVVIIRVVGYLGLRFRKIQKK